jgi:hypothetical protein
MGSAGAFRHSNGKRVAQRLGWSEAMLLNKKITKEKNILGSSESGD